MLHSSQHTASSLGDHDTASSQKPQGYMGSCLGPGFVCMSPERKRASIVSVLLLFGLGHIRWDELKEWRENAYIPFIESVSEASKDCVRNRFVANMNKSTNRDPWNIVGGLWLARR